MTRRCAFLVASCLAMAPDAFAQTPAPATAPPQWKTAAPGRRLAFPADHASHPEYKLEWWYYTGNLGTDDGRRFGYQITFFRVGVNPAAGEPVGLGGARSLHGASGGNRRERAPASVHRTAQSRRSGMGGRRHRSASRLERRLGSDAREGQGACPARDRDLDERRTAVRRRPASRRRPSAGAARRPGLQPQRDPIPATPRTTTRCRACRPAGRCQSTAAPSRSPASAGWITSSAPAFSSRSKSAGTGSPSSSKTVAA